MTVDEELDTTITAPLDEKSKLLRGFLENGLETERVDAYVDEDLQYIATMTSLRETKPDEYVSYYLDRVYF